LLEQAISGYVTQAITDGADTTITIPNGATGVARNMFIEMTGALTATRNLIVPANKKLYFIYNNTTGGFAVTVKVSGQTGVSVPNGKKVILVSNGTDIVNAENYIASLSVGALTSGRVTYASTAGLLADSANLLWDGTTFGVTGRLYNGSASTFGASTWAMSLGNGGASANYFKANDTYWQNAAGTQTMTLDSSGNLGIGTTSPGARLDVFSSRTSSTNAIALILSDGVTGAQTDGVYKSIRSQSNGSSSVSEIRFVESDGSNNNTAIAFATQSSAGGLSERMRIDQKGNVGIGITLSSWGSTVRAEELGTSGSQGAVWLLNNGSLYSSFNNYYDGTNFKYKNSSYATIYNHGSNGKHVWQVAASGTAGNNITFTEAMTLDNSGNLGIGTTSPYTKLQVTGTIKVATGNAQGILSLGDGNGATVNCGVYRGAAVAPTTDGNYLNLGGYDGIVFATGNAVIASQTERMRIDSSGNLSIGTTATNGRLSIQGSGSYNSTGWGVASDLSVRSTEMTDSAYHSILQLVSIRQSLSTGSGANGFLGFSTIDDSNNTGINDALRIAAVNETGNSNTSSVAMSFWTNAGGSAGNAPTEKMRITGAGNVGIGTSSPGAALHVSAAFQNQLRIQETGGTFFDIAVGARFDLRNAAGTTIVSIAQGGSPVGTQLNIDTSGNLGLGSVIPAAWISSTLQIEYGAFHSHYYGASNNQTLMLNNAYVASDTNFKYIYTGASLSYVMNNGAGWFWNAAGSGTAGTTISYTTRMNLTDTGILLVGTTQSNPYSGFEINPNGGASFQTIGHLTGTSSGTAYMNFNYNQSGCGSITQNGTSAVLYNTSSDYRLKNITGALTGYKERLMSLQPKQGTWKIDGSEFRGFLAHEFAEPYGASVTGEKDAVNADNKPIMQAMQASSSEVMADLVAFVQELNARLTTLENK
jgi:hypothetical protein